MVNPIINAIDLFCGAGGLSLGLKQAGVTVVAGVDLDGSCKYPYEENIGAGFLQMSVADVTPEMLIDLWPEGGYRLLAGCAPCQPFSSHRRGADTKDEDNWSLLNQFGRLVAATLPEFVTMENVTRLRRFPVFEDFVALLQDNEYAVDYDILRGPDFGLPQERRRLVLVASRIGGVKAPVPVTGITRETVRTTIGKLPNLRHGEADPNDPLHKARALSDLNERRIKASKPGGTWRDWPEDIRAECHLKSSGASFQAFYGRMTWDEPAPTITTQAYNFGTGRFGHPEQDRGLTLREAAMLQGFPREYRFTPDGVAPTQSGVGKLIGNAVPPQFGKAIGDTFLASLKTV